MKVLIKPRQSGKTVELIKQAANCNGYIVCINHAEAVRVAKMAKEMGIIINFPLTAAEFIAKQYSGMGVGCVYIDNADIILQSISKVPIKVITLTE